jgi:hypothetical protein
MSRLYEVIETLVKMNREVSIRHDPDSKHILISVIGFNKSQNVKASHFYTVEKEVLPAEEVLAHIITLLNENIK